MIEIRGDKKVLITPISEEDLADIKIGDIVWLDGDLMTCRDVAHRRLVELSVTDGFWPSVPPAVPEYPDTDPTVPKYPLTKTNVLPL